MSPETLDPALTPENLQRILTRWIELHPAEILPWRRVLSVEEAFVSRVWESGGRTVRLICRPDAVVEDHFGRVRWVDTKTTSWRISDPSWKRALRLSLQAALYTDAIAQRYGDAATLGGWFNAMELRKLPSDPKRKCKEHGTPYAECGNEHAKTEFVEALTTMERVGTALDDARLAAMKFVRMFDVHDEPSIFRMEGSANGACRFCSASEWCEGGRLAATLDGFMVHDPWIVEEGVKA